MEIFNIHLHTDMSNIKLRDSTNKVKDVLEYALKLGLPGVAITDHSSIGNHIKATRYIEDNPDKFKDFTLGLGEEFYLCDREEIEKAVENNEKVRFPHFLVLAKNKNGYEFLKRLTTREWENSFWYRGMQRTPTYYEDLIELTKGYEDDIIFSSACIGSPLHQMILEYHYDRTKENQRCIHKFITFFINIVGKDDFYLELQPAIKHDGSNKEIKQEQQIVNDMLLKLSEAYGLKCIVTTDAHYLHKDQAFAHETFLKSANGEREVQEFYSTTYMMNRQELLEYFDEELLDKLIANTHEIMNKIEPITFKSQTRVPTVDIPPYEDSNLFDRYLDRYKYIDLYKHSTQAIDRYYLHLIGEGMVRYNQEFNEENLSRIDLELEQIWEISLKLEQALSSYFVLTKDIVDMMWEVSIVGTARGSASCYYTNYLLGIVQFNPIEYNLPYYRFLSKERASLPD